MVLTNSRVVAESGRPLRLALVRWAMFFLAGCGWNSMGPSACAASVTVYPPTATVQVGQQVQLSATVRDTAGDALSYGATWGSDNPPVATVNQTGLVTGVSVGHATITATSDAQSGSALITVTAAATRPARAVAAAYGLPSSTLAPGP